MKVFLTLLLFVSSFLVSAQQSALPSIVLKDMDGKAFNISDLAKEEKPVVLSFWATWCGPCQYELPHLKELEKKMHGKKIVFVSISCDKDKAAWEKMVKEQGLGGVQLHNGGDREFMTAFGIRGIPRFILLDKEGKIVNPNMTRPSNPETEKTLKALKGI